MTNEEPDGFSKKERELYDKYIEFMGKTLFDEILGIFEGWDEFREFCKSLLKDFKTTICTPYKNVFENVRDRRFPSHPDQVGETATDLAARYGVNRGNIDRWLFTEQKLSFESFCLVSAAENKEYPRGHLVALPAYEQASNSVATAVKHEDAGKISQVDYLKLYHANRHPKFFLNILAGDESAVRHLSEQVTDLLDDEFPGAKVDADELRQIAISQRLIWLILAKELPNGWFG